MAKADKEIEKARKRFGDAFDEISTEQKIPVLLNIPQHDSINQKFVEAMGKGDMPALKAWSKNSKCWPSQWLKEWTDVRQFNLIFHTQLGNIAGEEVSCTSAPKPPRNLCQFP